MTCSADVVVVGGGAIGACVALELTRRGTGVTLLERSDRVEQGCSSGNAGLLCPSHSTPLASPDALAQGLRWMLRSDSPFHIRPRAIIVPWLARFIAASTERRVSSGTEVISALSRRSLELHSSLFEAGLDTGFERRGVLNTYETVTGYADGRREAMRHGEAGMRVEVLGAAAARALEPSLSRSVVGAVYYPDEAHCDPMRFVKAVRAAAAEHGAVIHLGAELTGFVSKGSRVVAIETTMGTMRPGSVVLAAGAWTRRLSRPLGLFVPIEAGKGCHIDLEKASGDPYTPVFMQESRVVATPLEGRLRLSGTLELAGLDESIRRVRIDAILQAAERTLGPLGHRQVLGVWSGLRPCTPDGLPMIGRTERAKNVIVAAGHAMMGMTLAPITGKFVADILSGREPGFSAALSPDRFRSLRIRRANHGRSGLLPEKVLEACNDARRKGVHRH